MEAIEKVANASVARACGFGALAIFCSMAGFSYEPHLAARLGGTLSLVMTLVLVSKATYARRMPYKRTETWLMLRDDDRPPPAIAQMIIGMVLRRVFLQYARYSAFTSVVLLVLGTVLGTLVA